MCPIAAQHVEGMDPRPVISEEDLQRAQDDLHQLDLGLIEEGEEEDSETEDEVLDTESIGPGTLTFSPSEVAQAFSHFSYRATGRKRLICDIQGVYDEDTNVLKLSDPVIHYYNQRNEERKGVHGSTDRGRKGRDLFFATHKPYCGKLCFLANLGFKKPQRSRQRDTTR